LYVFKLGQLFIVMFSLDKQLLEVFIVLQKVQLRLS